MKFWWKWSRRAAAAAVLLLVVAVVGFVAWRSLLQSQTAAARPQIDAKVGVNELVKVKIGGIDQWVHIRGQDRRNPVMLYVHGGPGTPMIPFSHVFQSEWEKHFTVVQWDQRGAGKTRFASDPKVVDKTIDFPRMEADAHELTQYLKTRFGQPKIFLLGHSWGSMLGVALAHDYPQDYYAYVGTGQVIEMQANERLGFEATLAEAKRRGDKVGIAELEALRPYPAADGSHLGQKIGVLRKWETTYGLGLSRKYRGDMTATMLKFALASPEYSLRDITYFFDEPNWPPLQRELNTFDISRYGTEFKVPMIFIEGRHDWQTPSVLVAEYAATLRAPAAKVIWLEASAHSPMVDEPEAFTGALVRDVLPYANAAPAAP